MTRLTGQQPVYPREVTDALAADHLEDDQIGIIVQSTPENGKQRTRIYVMSLARWHVNLIVLPVLAVSIGRATVLERTAIALTGVPLLLLLDGCLASVFLSLAARRIRGEELLSHTFHSSLEHGLAVYGTKILPIVVWALLYVAIRYVAPWKPRSSRRRT